jgi:ADP-ribosylglycohydrolase
MRQRFRGSLLGLAAGEALGAPAQLLTPEQVAERWGVLTEMVGGGVHDVAPGETTDSTAMMLCLAESLGTCPSYSPGDVISRYLAWFQSNPKDVALVVRTALLGIMAGTSPDLAARRAHEILGHPTAGNASLMRCAPVALRYFADPRARRESSLRESELTHFDRLAGWACVALNDLIAAALAQDLRGQLLQIAASLEEEDSRISLTLREAAVAEPEEIHAARPESRRGHRSSRQSWQRCRYDRGGDRRPRRRSVRRGRGTRTMAGRVARAEAHCGGRRPFGRGRRRRLSTPAQRRRHSSTRRGRPQPLASSPLPGTPNSPASTRPVTSRSTPVAATGVPVSSRTSATDPSAHTAWPSL